MPRDSKYHQGLFHPRHPEKYVGDVNNIVYRSSWELRFLQYCDSNDNIIQYASEEFSIPYLSPIDNKVHRYYPDYLIKVKESNGSIKKYVIEVKPKRQTEKPKKRSRVTKTYINEMTPILNYYDNQELLVKLNGMDKIDDIYKEIRQIIAVLKA